MNNSDKNPSHVSIRIIETSWIIQASRQVQTQDALSEAIVNYRELRAVKYWC